MIEDTLVVLPIAGDAGRFWPLKHKHFLPILGKPLLSHTLKLLEKAGLCNILAVVNSENESQFKSLSHEFPKLSINIVQQSKGEGIGAALLSARSYLSNKIILLSPHDIVDENLIMSIADKIRQNSTAFVVGKRMTQYFPGGYLIVENDKLKKIIEKPDHTKQPSDIIALVMYYFPNSQIIIDGLLKSNAQKDDQFEQVLSKLLAKGFDMEVVDYNGFWGYLKYPWHVLLVMNYFLKDLQARYSTSAKIDKRATILGPVIIEENAIIQPNATIIGPTYIGKGVMVGINSLIRHSHIGQGTVVGFSTEIARSYIGSNSWFHSNYIGDSVIGNNVSMGAGTVVANLRIDENEIYSRHSRDNVGTNLTKLGVLIGDHVRIGVNASLMPGVKIGSNVSIGPSLVIRDDIPDNKACILSPSSYKLINNLKPIRSRAKESFHGK